MTHADAAPKDQPRGRYLLTLALTALGVVYGDIGTSPLYALRECFSGAHGVAPSQANVLGVLSLIFWSLILVISIKYLVFVLRADHRGEGGILALMALIGTDGRPGRRPRWVVVMVGLFGAALLYGDGMITPVISVLGAIEGLEVATPLFRPYIVPIAIAILAGLFLFQKLGTAGVGAVFGPVVLIWFATIGALGLSAIVKQPAVLAAVHPAHGVAFFARNGEAGFLVLGAVFLVVTGGEALYADMGHFGRRPIRIGWFVVVLPALLLNYFGQGALLLERPDAAANPFYLIAPRWALGPLIVVATAAAIIASQAVISGAYSLTRQAVQLGYAPRLAIQHTSSEEIGQIYVPSVNWALMAATIALVIGFGSSSAIAAAYGIAVTSTMVITTALLVIVARERWRWSWLAAAPLMLVFLVVDLSFFGANISKVAKGGWFPLAMAAVVFTLMTTWKRGREILSRRLLERSVPLRVLLADIAADPPLRVPGSAVFMVRTPGIAPPALVHNLAHNKVLHEQVVFLSVMFDEVPSVPPSERVAVEALGKGFYAVTARFGFMQDPNVPRALAQCAEHGLNIVIPATTFFLGLETLVRTERPAMARWRATLFGVMSRNAARVTTFFRLIPEQVFEVGVQVEL